MLLITEQALVVHQLERVLELALFAKVRLNNTATVYHFTLDMLTVVALEDGVFHLGDNI
jgi:hypothetical protein